MLLLYGSGVATASTLHHHGASEVLCEGNSCCAAHHQAIGEGGKGTTGAPTEESPPGNSLWLFSNINGPFFNDLQRSEQKHKPGSDDQACSFQFYCVKNAVWGTTVRMAARHWCSFSRICRRRWFKSVNTSLNSSIVYISSSAWGNRWDSVSSSVTLFNQR